MTCPEPDERTSPSSSGTARGASISVENYRIPVDRFYDPVHHLWVAPSGSEARIGLDCLGQDVSGSISFVLLRPIGTRLRAGETFGSIESQKFVGALLAPVGGEIRAANPRVQENPGLVNTDPFGEGWLVVMGEVDPRELGALVRGEVPVRRYFETGVAAYRARGILAEASGETASSRS